MKLKIEADISPLKICTSYSHLAVEIPWPEFQIYRADFEAVDTDRNGELEGPEVVQLLSRQSGRIPSQEEVKSFLEQTDR